MTKDELRIHVIEHVVGTNAEGWVGQAVKKALDAGKNDVDKTIQLLIDSGTMLFQGGCVSDIEFDLFCGYRGKGKAWLPGHNSWNSEPDLYFEWKDIVEYVKNGCPKHVQMELF